MINALMGVIKGHVKLLVKHTAYNVLYTLNLRIYFCCGQICLYALLALKHTPYHVDQTRYSSYNNCKRLSILQLQCPLSVNDSTARQPLSCIQKLNVGCAFSSIANSHIISKKLVKPDRMRLYSSRLNISSFSVSTLAICKATF